MGYNGEVVLLSDDSDDDIAIVGSSRARSVSPIIVGSSRGRSPSPIVVRETAPAAIEILSQTLESDTDDDDLGAALANNARQPRAYSAASDVASRRYGTSMSFGAGSPGPSSRKASTSSYRSALPLDDVDVNTSAPKHPKKRRKADDCGSDEEVTKAQKQELAEKRKREKQEAAEAEKAAKKLSRDEAKAAKEAEKSYQAKLKDANRLRISKMDALRDLEVHLAHDLSLPTSPIAGALPEIKARLEESRSKLLFQSEEDTVVNSMIRFRRRVASAWDETQKRFVPLETEHYEWEPTFVVVTSVDAIVDQIAEDDNLFIRWLRDVRLTMGIKADEQVLLLVRGMAKYHSKSVSVVNKSYREHAAAHLAGGTAARPQSKMTRVSKEMVETELLQAQVAEQIFVVLVDDTVDVEDWLFNLAGDVALRPYKKLEKSHLSFAAAEGQRKAQDPAEALEYMLQEIPGVTAAAAGGITEQYRNFRDLMLAYEDAERGGVSEAESLVEGAAINRLVTGAASSRRIGKGVSKRVYDILRSKDPLALY